VGRHEARDGFAGNGPVIMAVDALPAELPREASQSFSDALVGLVPGLARADRGASFDDWDLPAALKRATILHHGKFTPEYAYMDRFI
jgi:alpha-aminoadipic semialdehyde synthase